MATSDIISGRGHSDFALDVANVSKVYRGKVHALRGITMRVNRGAVFGLLGPNGAGKSTLVKIMLTIIKPSRCEGTMLGLPVGDKNTLARVGYLPEHHRFPDYLTASQVLDFYGAMAKVDRSTRRRRGPELLELVGLKEWGDKKVKGFSKGMRQRLGIANALMNDPDLLVLDEPTDGVDPVGRRDIRNILLHLKSQNKTIFLNSHLLSELEMVCDHVAILVQGVVSSQGTIDDLTRDSRRYEIEVSPPDSAAGNTRFLPESLAGLATLGVPQPGRAMVGGAAGQTGSELVLHGTLRSGIPIQVDNGLLRVGTEDPQEVQPLIDVLRARGFTIKAVRPLRASLEDLFMQAVTDPTTGAVLAPGAATNKKKGRGGDLGGGANS